MPRTPVPGRPVRGSSTGRPVMAAMDLLGRRWALRILWELDTETLRALDLKERCDQMSSSVLYQRLRELTEARLVQQDVDGGFRLTKQGKELRKALLPLDAWSRRWATKAGRG